jgi:hypothetical protein
MKDLTTLNKYRIRKGPYASELEDSDHGAFSIPLGNGKRFHIIASSGMGWDHVSVHVRIVGKGKAITPNLEEMCKVKDLFFDEEECVVQYHPRKSEYVDMHPHVLHLWRPNEPGVSIPEPRKEMV